MARMMPCSKPKTTTVAAPSASAKFVGFGAENFLQLSIVNEFNADEKDDAVGHWQVEDPLPEQDGCARSDPVLVRRRSLLRLLRVLCRAGGQARP